MAQVLFALLFSSHPFVPEEQITSGRSCIMIVIENSLKGEIIMPSGAQGVSQGLMDLLRKILVPDPNQRYTVTEIFNHPWFQVRGPIPIPKQAIPSC